MFEEISFMAVVMGALVVSKRAAQGPPLIGVLAVITDDSTQRQLLSAASTPSSIFFASPNSIRLFSL